MLEIDPPNRKFSALTLPNINPPPPFFSFLLKAKKLFLCSLVCKSSVHLQLDIVPIDLLEPLLYSLVAVVRRVLIAFEKNSENSQPRPHCAHPLHHLLADILVIRTMRVKMLQPLQLL